MIVEDRIPKLYHSRCVLSTRRGLDSWTLPVQASPPSSRVCRALTYELWAFQHPLAICRQVQLECFHDTRSRSALGKNRCSPREHRRLLPRSPVLSQVLQQKRDKRWWRDELTKKMICFSARSLCLVSQKTWEDGWENLLPVAELRLLCLWWSHSAFW